MVYVYAKHSKLQKYIGKKISKQDIKKTLIELGMDIKGETKENDSEYKIEITAEKIDMVSDIGIARAIKHYLGLEKKTKKYLLSKSNHKVIVQKSLELEKVRPKTCAAIVYDIKMSQDFLDKIIELQEKLHETFGRGRKKAAIGVYPLNKIKFPVYYKAEHFEKINFPPLGEKNFMKAKDILNKTDTGKKYKHLLKDHINYPIFIDSNKNILSMPPIINSENIGKVELTDKSVFIEVSGFSLKHLDNILKTLIINCIEMGAKAKSVLVEYKNSKNYELTLNPSFIKVSKKYINSLIGLSLTNEQIKKIALNMMLEVTSVKDDILLFQIPCFKADIWSKCDIADEIARGFGYNNIQIKYNSVESIGKVLKLTQEKNLFVKTLIGMQFIELYTYMLTSTSTQFEKMCLSEKNSNFEKIKDACEQGYNMLRINILPEILLSLRFNRRRKYPQKVFEIGFTIKQDKTLETKAKDISKLCCVIAEPTSNYTKIKEVIDTISNIHKINLKFKEEEFNFLIKGRSAKIFYKKKEVGFIGEVAPQILENFSLHVPVSCFEINLDEVLKNLGEKKELIKY